MSMSVNSMRISGELKESELQEERKEEEGKRLDFSKRITDANLESTLKYYPQLQTLNLNHCEKITDTGLKHIAQ